MMRIAVLGLGLIGGSVALGARRRLGADVVGIDFERVIVGDGASELVHELVPVEDQVRVSAACRGADLVVMAAPVRTILAQLPDTLANAPAVTDCGSTKGQLVRLAQGLPRGKRFVPGHPMAGGAHGGLRHARSDLFEGRVWVVCPEDCEADALRLVEGMVRGLGATIATMAAEEHDRVVAMVSHVPQILANVLGSLGETRGASRVQGPTYQAFTRTAGGDPSVWLDIFATNAEEVARALREFCREVARVADALERLPVDLDPVSRLLERGRGVRTPRA
jgi:prephenate dehydrogenase